ncbi:hypothetical protein HR12_34480 [Microbacterium sp. SUBG005]|nr:hypothetical protein HR12_34480 [Microbacterium sp. SUBG005]
MIAVRGGMRKARRSSRPGSSIPGAATAIVHSTSPTAMSVCVVSRWRVTRTNSAGLSSRCMR